MTEKPGSEEQLKQIGRLLLMGGVIGTAVLLGIIFLRNELTLETLFFVGIWLVWAVFMLTRSDMLRRG
ncbi:MAG: hypothetical protein SNJ58_09515 [Aggregatilineales bacterium]